MGSGLARKWAPGLSVETPKRPPPRSLTHAAWLLSRPLVILLARDCLLPHQLKGRLALKLEGITVAKPGAFPPAVGRYARISATALLDLCKTGKEKTETHGDSMPLGAEAHAAPPPRGWARRDPGGLLMRNPARSCLKQHPGRIRPSCSQMPGLYVHTECSRCLYIFTQGRRVYILCETPVLVIHKLTVWRHLY